MKKYHIASIIFPVLFLFFQGCEKDLQEDPKTFINPASYFTTASSYDAAVMGIYESALSYTSDGNVIRMLEMFSDIYGPPSASVEQAMQCYKNGTEPFFYNVRSAWAIPYTVIKNANFVLSQMPSPLNTDASNKALMAEARFLRAYSYFMLVQLFGDVPLRTEPVVDFSKVQLSRSSQADVYKFILEDLTYAEANLPETAPQQGRVYKLAATALLSRVYLTSAGNPLNITANFQLAKEKALAVINSGKFSLVSDYSKAFHNTAYTSESIWERL